jgi:hypothetical protein
MNKTMKMCGTLTAIMLAGSIGMAQHHGDYRGSEHHAYGHYASYGHGGYYHSSCGNLAVGLLGIGMFAAAVTAADRPVYVQQPVVYQSPPVVYVQQIPVVQQPQVVYQAPPVVQQQAPVEPPQPATLTVNIQNSNGSYTPVILRQVGPQWVGPKGEYYDTVPSVGQLRPVYGF